MFGLAYVTRDCPLSHVESQAAQVIVGKPVVLERGYLVLAGGLPMALGHRETIGIGLALDEALEGLCDEGQSLVTPTDALV